MKSVRIQTWRSGNFLTVEPDETQSLFQQQYFCYEDGVYLGVTTAKELGALIEW